MSQLSAPIQNGLTNFFFPVAKFVQGVLCVSLTVSTNFASRLYLILVEGALLSLGYFFNTEICSDIYSSTRLALSQFFRNVEREKYLSSKVAKRSVGLFSSEKYEDCYIQRAIWSKKKMYALIQSYCFCRHRFKRAGFRNGVDIGNKKEAIDG